MIDVAGILVLELDQAAAAAAVAERFPLRGRHLGERSFRPRRPSTSLAVARRTCRKRRAIILRAVQRVPAASRPSRGAGSVLPQGKARKKSPACSTPTPGSIRAMYEFWQALGRGYTRFQDFMAHLPCLAASSGFFVEIVSDGADLRRHRRGADDRAGAARLRGHRLGPVQQGRGHLGHLPRPLRQRDRPPRHPLRRFRVRSTSCPTTSSRRRSRPRTGASTTISASTSSAPLRALVNNAQGDNGTQGGSSITQQLAKNLFLTSERTLERKIKEAFLAVWLECALHQGRDPQALFRPRLYGRRQFRRRGGRRVLFRQEGHRHQPRRSGDARRPVQGARPTTRRTSTSRRPAAAPTWCSPTSSMPAS